MWIPELVASAGWVDTERVVIYSLECEAWGRRLADVRCGGRVATLRWAGPN